MKEVRQILLRGQGSPSSLQADCLEVLKRKLNDSFREVEVLEESDLSDLKNGSPQFLLAVLKDSVFKIKIGYIADSEESMRISKFIKEEVRKWIVLFGYSIEVVNVYPLKSDNKAIPFSLISISDDENCSRLSDTSFIESFCDTIISGFREYITSN